MFTDPKLYLNSYARASYHQDEKSESVPVDLSNESFTESSRLMRAYKKLLRVSSSIAQSLPVSVLTLPVSLAMHILRMVKMLGWEPKVKEQIAEMRSEELVYTRKTKLLNLINSHFK